jgi:serine/threonine-protein kinase RIO1
MLDILIRKSGNRRPKFVNDIMIYLLKTIINRYPSYKIGILVMPMLDRSMPLYEYLQNASSRDDRKSKAQLVSNVVNLLLFMKTIHMDLHLNNALKVDNELYLIDFGRASDLRSGRRDEYFKPNQKFDMLGVISNFEIVSKNMTTFEENLAYKKEETIVNKNFKQFDHFIE